MRRSTLFILTSLLFLSNPALAAPEPECEEEKGESLILRDVQGGFAGFTGTQITIHPDGKWTVEEVSNEKLTPQKSGQLNPRLTTRFSNMLKDNLDRKLPEQINGPPKVNPHLVELQYGQIKTTLVLNAGEALPLPTKEDTPRNRVLRVLHAANNVIKLAEKPQQEPERQP